MSFKKTISIAALSWILLVAATPANAGPGAFETYGNIGAVGVPLVAGIISLTKQDHKGFWQLGAGYAATMGTTLALKYTIDETRPNGGKHSFPSGHTASAFAGASYLQFRYGWRYGIPAYAAAALVGWSRVDSNKHHWRDVIAAAAIANISAYFLTDRFHEQVAVVPIVDPEHGTYGLTAAMRF